MQAAGYPISDHYSGFRSYETQTKLYQDYVNQDGKEAADRYSARPGYSEHQTGLAFDLIGTDGDLVTEEKRQPSGSWIMRLTLALLFAISKARKKRLATWRKNGIFATSEKRPKKLLQVVSV